MSSQELVWGGRLEQEDFVQKRGSLWLIRELSLRGNTCFPDPMPTATTAAASAAPPPPFTWWQPCPTWPDWLAKRKEEMPPQRRAAGVRELAVPRKP